MSADLLERTFAGHRVRIVVVDGEPRFPVVDVCAVLGIANPRMAASRLDRDGVSLADVIDGMGRTQATTVVDEGGLYELILRSDKPDARAFSRWVTREVLPEIRQTGSYLGTTVALPASLPEALRMAADIAEERDRAQRALEAATPKAEAWDAVADADGDHSLREAAQMLVRGGVDTGQNRLARYLRDIGWCDRKGRPYQPHVEAGRLALRTRTFENPRTHEEQVTTQVRVTAKGVEQLLQMMRPSPAGDTAAPA